MSHICPDCGELCYCDMEDVFYDDEMMLSSGRECFHICEIEDDNFDNYND